MTRLVDFFKAIRWLNLLLVFLAQIMVVLKFSNFNLTIDSIILFTTIILALGNLENNILDRDLDINCKGKSPNLFTDWVAQFNYIYIDISIFIGIFWLIYFQDFKAGILISMAYLILKSYNHQLKKMYFIGNLSIAFLCSLSLYILDIPMNSYFILLIIIIFILTLIREIIKDIEDKHCDQTFGYKTFAIQSSNQTILRFLITFIFLIVALIFNLYQDSNLIFIYLILLGFEVYFIMNQKWKKASLTIKIIILYGIMTILFIRN